ncbi:MAG TPA: hypothetical protein VGF59_21265 [Bryobacteraceae bacterium]|jgi:hypothetical protein
MKVLTSLCAAVLAIAGSALAQSTLDRISVRFDTPVTAGNTKLPAGDYTIQVLRGSGDNVILVARSSGSTVSLIANRISEPLSDTGDQVTLVMNRRGADLHLDRIVFPDRTGFQLAQ